MTTSMKKQQLYGEYINPTIDPCSPKKENPLVLMAQACNNIGKELSSSLSSSSSSSNSTIIATNTLSSASKQRKSSSPTDGKKALKRSAPTTSISPPAPKKMAVSTSIASSAIPSNNQHSFYLPPSPFMLDTLLLHHLSKSFNTSPFFSTTTPSFGYSANSAFTPSFSSSSLSSSQRSPYFMDSILAPLNPSPPAFVCNWMESNTPDGFCGKRFANHMSLLEHLCTAHTSLSSMKSSYPTSIFSSYYSPTSVGKL